NIEVVKTLGCPQPIVKSKFQQLLDDAKDSVEKGWTTTGMLVEGGFGTGKSHLLESLQQVALEQRFVTSRVVISKETTLFSPALMFRAAMESAVIPQKQGEALVEVARDLQFHSPQYVAFSEWVNRQGGEIDSRFAATLFLYERMVNDPELSHRMIRFWAGDPLSDAEIKRYLKACDSTVTYRFDKLTGAEMALQRLKFVSRLMIAAGYSGWILFIDEAEIIGRYSFKQRAQSYAELARWMGRLEASSFADLGYKSGLASVLALTDDFQSAILDEKGDRENVPAKLRETGSEADLVLARQAEQGMQLIECERIPLVGPYDELVEEIYHKIRLIHGQAYGWDPPHVPSIERLSSTRMREYVKGWITEWDLKRMAPDEVVEIELAEVKQDYSEDIELEMVTEDQVQPVLADVQG
ncbi:MAG: BREX system ATP-binding domain-containing protein, partial [Nitrospirales bacterium]